MVAKPFRPREIVDAVRRAVAEASGPHELRIAGSRHDTD
jgi:hypothetical protein